MLLITRGRYITCEHIFQKSVTTKYLITLHFAGANVNTNSNLCGSDIAVGYYAFNIPMCMTSCAMILMLNFIDLRPLFHKLLGGQHVPGHVINGFSLNDKSKLNANTCYIIYISTSF